MNSWIEFENNEPTVNVAALLKMLMSKAWIIIIVTLLSGALLLAYASFFITPLYRSSIKMYVNNRTEGASNISSSDIQAAQKLVDTYAVIMTSYPTLEAVAESEGVHHSYSELAGMISASAVNGTEVIKVTVTSDDPQEAAVIANAIAEIAPDQITEIVTGSSVKIVEYARVATHKSSPNVGKYAAMGMAVGFLFSCLAIVLDSIIRNGLSVEDRIRRDFNKPVLAVIPDGRTKGKQSVEPLLGNLDFAASEAYKLMRTNITFCFAEDQNCKIIGVTSAGRGEAKSTTSINTAYTMAQMGLKVCVVDCDLRLPTVGKKLKIRRKPGFSDLLVGQAKVNEVVQQYSAEDAQFFVIPAGTTPPNPSELLASARMEAVVKALRNTFDYVIFDLPPVGIVSDPLVVSKYVDGVIVTAREDQYERRTLSEVLRAFEKNEAKILGIVVTFSTAQQKEYKKYGYGYGYETASERTKFGKYSKLDGKIEKDAET